MEENQELAIKFEELGALEQEFEDVEVEIIKQADKLYQPLYKKRADTATKIPHFWALVFEQAPPEIDNFIQPTDSKVFGECLDSLEVSRFEINDPKGSPRSFSLKFSFSENEYFEDRVLEKKFWYRKTKDWAGIVSEPVKISWKKGKDLTGGLTDAAYALGQARKKAAADTSDGKARKAEVRSKEYKDLVKKIDTVTDASISFFGIFSFVSGYRWVSAEENEQAVKEEREKIEKINRGEQIEEDEDEDMEDTQDYLESEVFPNGDEVATIIAEDMWPNAIKYWKATFDEDGDDEELSDLDVMDADSDNAGAEDDDSDEEVDIRALVGKGRDKPPPAKKQRKA